MGSVRDPLMPGRRVLMVAHHFPPAGGSGANRALAFVRYLPAHGWEPLVLTPGVAWAANRDDRQLSELPPGVQVIRTRSLEARVVDPRRKDGAPPAPGCEPPSAMGTPSSVPPLERLARGAWSSSPLNGVGGGLRSNVGHLKRFPDAHLGWAPFAVAAATQLDYDVVYTSSGPFTSHVIGLLLKRFSGRPWVAELRDGWYRWNRAIFPDYPRWRGLLERRLEAAVLKAADHVVLVTDRMANEFRRQYSDLPSDHFHVVPNGFDRAQFLNLPPANALTARAVFEVVHSGAIYYGRSLAAFLDAAQLLVDTDPAFADAFRLTLLGTLDNAARAELKNHKLSARTAVLGQVDHAQALAAMASAQLLLLIANTTPGAEATVPGKLFEYLAVGRPVLAIAPPQSSTQDVLNQTGGGWLAPAGDPAKVTCVLRQAFQAHQAGSPVAADPRQVARFDRRLLTGDLANIFNQALQSAVRENRL